MYIGTDYSLYFDVKTDDNPKVASFKSKKQGKDLLAQTRNIQKGSFKLLDIFTILDRNTLIPYR
jgi:hypothetical protein